MAHPTQEHKGEGVSPHIMILRITCPPLALPLDMSVLGLSRFFPDFPDLLGDGPGTFPICPFPLSRPIKSTYEEQSRKGPRHNLDLSRKKWETPGFGNPPGPLNGGVSNGGVSRSGLVLPFLSFFVLFGTFPIFPGFSRFARGWSGDFPDLSFSSFSAY